MEVYKYVLKNGRPVGIREVQRALNLSSPRLAAYHLDKLEEVELVKKTTEGYIADRVFLQNSVRLNRILVPRFLFYSVLFLTIFIFELTLFKPTSLSKEYILGAVATGMATALFLYEAAKMLIKKGL